MKTIALIGLLMASLSSFAYEDGTYSCKNTNPDVPDNTYTITTTAIAGVQVPVLDIKRYFKSEDGINEITIKGVAMVSRSKNTELIFLNNIHLEFVDNKIQNCRSNDGQD